MMNARDWIVERIAVIGAGIVGIPMAALLAKSRVQLGSHLPAKVTIIQRKSATSGWKVEAINSGKCPLRGVEPHLHQIISETVSGGLLKASHDFAAAKDADVILICVQTDKDGFKPDYAPLFEALKSISRALEKRASRRVPLVIFESTLAPTSMATLIKDHFSRSGYLDGRNIMLGNSPNRVMPGYLVDRIRTSDKLIGGLRPDTPNLIRRLYSQLVETGALHLTNCTTAEIVKTLENAYRDVRIAYSAEVARYCDQKDIDFYEVRERVNERLQRTDDSTSNPQRIPTGSILIPTIGVGGHCLPKDGILLLWRMLEAGMNKGGSLILEARRINDKSPAEAVRLMEMTFGLLEGKSIALLGGAYRFNSEDTRNSPSLVLAGQLLEKGCRISLHDPYVRETDQNLKAFGLDRLFTNDLRESLLSAEYIVFCTAHRYYSEDEEQIKRMAPRLQGVFDGCHLFGKAERSGFGVPFAGIGHGLKSPSPDLVGLVHQGFLSLERGFANEVKKLVDFLNSRYRMDHFNLIDFREVQRLAATCQTGCDIVDPGPVPDYLFGRGFVSRLVEKAHHIASGENLR